MAKEHAGFSQEQRDLIKLTAKETIEEYESKTKINERLQKVENKVFNGFGTKITILYGFYVLTIALLIKTAFF